MIFHPIPLATLQEFNVLLSQMETGCSAGTLNLPHVTEIDPAPHLSDSKLSLLQGSVLLQPLLKAPLPYLFIMWLTMCVYLTQHICLQGNLEISKGRAIYSSDEKWWQRQRRCCHWPAGQNYQPGLVLLDHARWWISTFLKAWELDQLRPVPGIRQVFRKNSLSFIYHWDEARRIIARIIHPNWPTASPCEGLHT